MIIAAFTFVFAEFLLESFGAYFAFKKKLTLLWVYLGYRATADIIGLVILTFFSKDALGYFNWIQKAGQNVILSCLIAYLIGILCNESNKAVMAGAWLLSLAVGWLMVGMFSAGAELMLKLTGAISVASLTLAIVLVAARYECRDRLPRHWSKAADGITVALVSTSVLMGLMNYWMPAGYLIPVGELTGLSMMVLAVKPVRIIPRQDEVEALHRRIEELQAMLKAQPYLDRRKRRRA